MRRVRSGYYKKKKRPRNIKMATFSLQKKLKKLLSRDLLSSSALHSFLQKKNLKKGPAKRKQSYLRRDIHEKQFFNTERKKKVSFKKLVQRNLTNQRFRIAQVSLLIIGGLWFSQLFIQPTFYLERIQVQGTEEISPEAIQALVNEQINKRSLLFIKKSHIFFLNEKKLAKKVEEQYALASLEFKGHWPSQILTVTVKEKDPLVLYNIEDRYYAIDADGKVIREIPNEEAQISSLPVIYQYREESQPEIGAIAFQPEIITSIGILNEGLSKYPSFEVHSYRLKESEQKKIVLKDKYSERKGLLEGANEEVSDNSEELLQEALDSVAQAKTASEKLLSLKQALGDIEVEKLEEERVEQLLQEQKEFEPNNDYALIELEVYTKAGWTLRLGHELLEHPEETEKYLNIFATLNGQVDLTGEVNEYVDLRFPNRIYYR